MGCSNTPLLGARPTGEAISYKRQLRSSGIQAQLSHFSGGVGGADRNKEEPRISGKCTSPLHISPLCQRKGQVPPSLSSPLPLLFSMYLSTCISAHKYHRLLYFGICHFSQTPHKKQMALLLKLAPLRISSANGSSLALHLWDDFQVILSLPSFRPRSVHHHDSFYSAPLVCPLQATSMTNSLAPPPLHSTRLQPVSLCRPPPVHSLAKQLLSSYNLRSLEQVPYFLGFSFLDCTTKNWFQRFLRLMSDVPRPESWSKNSAEFRQITFPQNSVCLF